MAVTVDKEKCTGCETCVAECPAQALFMEDGKAQCDGDKCVDCGLCISVCPVEAIS